MMNKQHININPNNYFDLSAAKLNNANLDISIASIDELSRMIVDDMMNVVRFDLSSIKTESQE